VIQPVGVIFKGSGFYVTDNRSKSSTMPPTRRDSKEGESAASGSESTPSDGKVTAESD
jgi:predicted nucleic acid-binding Zn ribbon protein